MKISGLIFFLPLSVAIGAEPVAVSALIQQARAVPSEFAADALLRIAATDQVDRSRKIELLEEAFQRASAASQPYRRRSALARNDGLAAYWNRVYAQELDALTLESRAVSAMLPLDTRKARELLLKIPPIKLPSVRCEEYLVYDVSRFYDTLGAVVLQAHDPDLLKPFAASLSSAVQVSPMIRTLLSAGLKDSELEALTNTLASALGKISGDDRSFTSSQSVGNDVLALVDELKRRQLSPLRIIEAYRVYLVWNLSSPRCGDDDLLQGGRLSFGQFALQPGDSEAGDFVSFFNRRLRIAPLQPIAETEATPARLEGAATGLRLCQEAECKAVVEQLRALVIGPDGIPYPASQRSAPEWQAKFRAFLNRLEQWTPAEGAPPAEFFRDKTQIYSELLNLAADGTNRELVMRSLLAFDSSSSMRKVNLLEWFLPANSVIARLALDPQSMTRFAAEVRESQDPLIGFYARVEALAPRTPDRLLPLL